MKDWPEFCKKLYSFTENDIIHGKENMAAFQAPVIIRLFDLKLGLTMQLLVNPTQEQPAVFKIEVTHSYTLVPHSSPPPALSAKSFPLLLSLVHLSATHPSVSSPVCPSSHYSSVLLLSSR